MLKNLDVDEAFLGNNKENELMEQDYEEFMQELEADKEMRSNVKLYKKNQSNKSEDKASSLQQSAGIKQVLSTTAKNLLRMQSIGSEDTGVDGDDEHDDEEIRIEE